MRIHAHVNHARWAGAGLELEGGYHQLDDLTPDQVVHLAAAAGAGALEITEADSRARKLIAKAIEPQAASEKAYARAVKDGRWLEGHQAQLETEAS